MGLESGAPSIFTTASVCKLVACMLICAIDIQKLYSISKFPKPKFIQYTLSNLYFLHPPPPLAVNYSPKHFTGLKKITWRILVLFVGLLVLDFW